MKIPVKIVYRNGLYSIQTEVDCTEVRDAGWGPFINLKTYTVKKWKSWTVGVNGFGPIRTFETYTLAEQYAIETLKTRYAPPQEWQFDVEV